MLKKIYKIVFIMLFLCMFNLSVKGAFITYMEHSGSCDIRYDSNGNLIQSNFLNNGSYSVLCSGTLGTTEEVCSYFYLDVKGSHTYNGYPILNDVIWSVTFTNGRETKSAISTKLNNSSKNNGILFYYGSIPTEYRTNDIYCVEMDSYLLFPYETFTVTACYLNSDFYNWTAGMFYYWEIY